MKATNLFSRLGISLIALATLLAPSFASAAISFVQANGFPAGSVPGAACNNSLSNVAAGDLLIFTVRLVAGATQTSTLPVDNLGNTWKLAVSKNEPSGSNSSTEVIYYAMNVAGGATSATTTINTSSTTFHSCLMAEYSGVALSNALDVTSGNTGTSQASLNSGTSTTNFANELIVGAGSTFSPNVTFTPAAGYTQRATSTREALQDQIGVAIGANNSAMTLSASTGIWIGVMAAFQLPPKTTPSYILAGKIKLAGSVKFR